MKNITTPCHDAPLLIVTLFDMYDGDVADRIYCRVDGCDNEWNAKGEDVG